MSAGIYKITFRDGSYYIGKSNDLARRWDQHAKNMVAGKHAKKLQDAFDRFGEPTYEVLINCHEDHLDTLEGVLINSNWSSDILNTTRPKMISEKEWKEIQHIPASMWMEGPIANLTQITRFASHIVKLNNMLEDAEKEYEKNLEEVKSGTLVEILEREKSQLKQELDAIKSRGFFARLFNN